MEDFLSWSGKRFQGNREDFEDAWQDAVIVFYENVMSKKLTSLHCELRTYLFAVGYKRLLKNHRKMKRFFWRDTIDDAILKDHELIAFSWDEPWAEEREMLLAAIEKLPKQCQEILLSRYYEEKNLQEIQIEFNYSSLNTVSASLSRCTRQLKDIIEEKMSHK